MAGNRDFRINYDPQRLDAETTQEKSQKIEVSMSPIKVKSNDDGIKWTDSEIKIFLEFWKENLEEWKRGKKRKSTGIEGMDEKGGRTKGKGKWNEKGGGERKGKGKGMKNLDLEERESQKKFEFE
uniref:Uncharacterized protein n=1 Tax=Rhizophagus irregularis (strain DAOM 181602 / DAOM 197198 / MUCL 43194) TaxID=747089 RepID=U9UGZ3_RHIID